VNPPERARLFVALELPPVVRAALVQWRSEQLDGVQGLRPVDPEALHVTLCFLGWQPATQIEVIAAACQRIGSEPRAVLGLDGALWLPARRPRVLAVALEDRGHALSHLQAVLAGALEDGGWYRREQRRFLAHVTVARVRRGTQVRPPLVPAPVPISFPGVSVTLYRSHLGASGARYERLAAVQLSGSAAA
jgi:2'-5' RNA ligase